jgi:hypothetical protein
VIPEEEVVKQLQSISFQDKNVDAMSEEEEIHMVFAMRRYK